MARRRTPASLRTGAADNRKCLCVCELGNQAAKLLSLQKCIWRGGDITHNPSVILDDTTTNMWCQRLFYKTFIRCCVFY